jgi:ribosomal protein L16 Arg81 hydroxylase
MVLRYFHNELNKNESQQSRTHCFVIFAELQEAFVVTLNPGDVLFVPHYWWHYVENVGTAVSINSWIPLVSNQLHGSRSS